MTITILILLSVLSMLGVIKFVAMTADTTLKKIFEKRDDEFVVYFLFLFFLGVSVFLVTYSAINNTFFHFKY
jgi:hypothetical protein